MKHLWYFPILLFLLACSGKEASTTDSHVAEVEEGPDFSWLVGEWRRTNNAPEKETFEYWEQRGEAEYTGLGITLAGTDTTFMENLRIAHIGGTWTFEVTGVNESPTLFPMLEIRAKGFTCINEANEFPKRIDYSLKGERLEAIISADSTQIPFHFIKITPQ